MTKVLLVARNEVLCSLGRRSFLFTAFGIPLIATVCFLGFLVFADSDLDVRFDTMGAGGEVSGQEGLVDHSGVIEEVAVPGSVGDQFVPYLDEASALEALYAGEIGAYYILPSDFVSSGELIYVNPGYNMLSPGDPVHSMRQVILFNLLDNDLEQFEWFVNVMDLERQVLDPVAARDYGSDLLVFLVPFAVTLILYVTVMLSANLLLTSMADEKQNRLLEILMLCVSPRQLLAGKLIGLGLMGLMQALTWIMTAFGLTRLGVGSFGLPPDVALPPAFVGWGLVFFLLGYVIYASLMAALGALAHDLKEASQVVMLITLPALVPVMTMVVLVAEPHGALATALSLFPPSAPAAMMLRLVAGGVPVVQILLAIALMLLTAGGAITMVSAVFRAQILLSGQPFSASRFFKVLVGRG